MTSVRLTTLIPLLALTAASTAQQPPDTPPWWRDSDYPTERRIGDAVGIAIQSVENATEGGSRRHAAVRGIGTFDRVRTEATRAHAGWQDYQAGNGWGVVKHSAFGVMHLGIDWMFRGTPVAGYMHVLADNAVYGLADVLTAASVGEYFAGVDVDQLRETADRAVASAQANVSESAWNTAEFHTQRQVEAQASQFGEPWEQEFWRLKNKELGGDWALSPEKRAAVWSEFEELQAMPSRRPAVVAGRNQSARESGHGFSGARLTPVEVSGLEPIRFRIFDHGREDGDRVTIYVTGEVVPQRVLALDVTMSNQGEVFEIPLSCDEARDGGRISVQIEALNTGSLHPNTGGIEILSVGAMHDPRLAKQEYALERRGATGSLRFVVRGADLFCGTTGDEVLADLLDRGALSHDAFLQRAEGEGLVGGLVSGDQVAQGLFFVFREAVIGEAAGRAARSVLQAAAREALARGFPQIATLLGAWQGRLAMLVGHLTGATLPDADELVAMFHVELSGVPAERYTVSQIEAAIESVDARLAAAEQEWRRQWRQHSSAPAVPGDRDWAAYEAEQITLGDISYAEFRSIPWIRATNTGLSLMHELHRRHRDRLDVLKSRATRPD